MTTRFPNHNDRNDVDAIAKVLDWTSAKITNEGKGWLVSFVDADGKPRWSHTKAIASTQLRQWIAGAMTMRGLVERERKELAAQRAAGAAEKLTDFFADELIAEVKRRDEAGSLDITEAFADEVVLSDTELRERCAIEAIELWDDDKAHEAGLAAMVDTQVFQLAARLAHCTPRETCALQFELRHALSVEHNLFNAECATLI